MEQLTRFGLEKSRLTILVMIGLLVMGVEREEELGRGADGGHPLPRAPAERARPLEERCARVRAADGDGGQDGLLVGEVLVDGPLGHADRVGEAVHRQSEVAARQEHVLGGVEERALAVADLLLLRAQLLHPSAHFLTDRQEWCPGFGQSVSEFARRPQVVAAEWVVMPGSRGSRALFPPSGGTHRTTLTAP